MIFVTTFAGWLSDQDARQDEVGQLARLWAEISPGRISGLQGVTRHLQAHAEENTLTWVYRAIQATTEEFRAWKANPDAASVHAPAVATQLDRIEHMLRVLLDNLGVPMISEVPDGDGADVVDIETGHPVAHSATAMVPVIGPNGLEHVEAGSRISPALAAEAMMTLDAAGKPDWAVLYGAADHTAEEAE